jgi:glycosyltransferase involved in cell wall biosynthesis
LRQAIFSDNLTDTELIKYHQECQALIFPGVEDFGLTPLEAQACGKPVIAYRDGGVLESVVESVTGEFFSPQTPIALEKVIKEFNPNKYLPENCRNQAKKFNKESFKEKFKERMKELWINHQKKFKI